MKNQIQRLTVTAALILFHSLSGVAQEAWDLVPSGKGSPTAAVAQALKNGDSSEALKGWLRLVVGTEYSKTPNGQAVFAYLLAKNGLPFASISEWKKIESVSSVSPTLLARYRSLFPLANWITRSPLAAGFSETLYPAPIVAATRAVYGKGFLSAEKYKKIENETGVVKNLSPVTPEKIAQNGALLFEAASQLMLEDHPGASVKILTVLLDNQKSSGLDKDKVQMALARALFQEGKFQDAITFYKKVDQDSDFWFEALEEQAWAFLRLKEPNRSLALLRTSTADVFKGVVGAENFFQANYILMKLCDYKDVFEWLEKFKKAFRERSVALNTLTNQGVTGETAQALNSFYSDLKWTTVGPEMKRLPRLFYRDEAFLGLWREYNELNRERTALEPYLGINASSSVAVTTLLSIKRALTQSLSGLSVSQMRAQSELRLKALAYVENKEIGTNLQKMHLIEAETIQRLFSYKQVSPNIEGEYKDQVKQQSKDTLVFQANDELWLDELDKYQVEVKGCPTEKEIRK